MSFTGSLPEFKNESGLAFVDISSEDQRTYVYPGDFTILIDSPLKLNVSKSGGHRVFDAWGRSHYIQPGWKHLHWHARPGQPNFVK